MKLELSPNTLRRNRIISTLMSSHESSVNQGQDFKLKSTQEFENRAKAVFEGLENTQPHSLRNNPAPAEQSVPDEVSQPDPIEVFAKPVNVAPKWRKRSYSATPDYVRNPKKWTKYSLADVPEHSDRDNVKAARLFFSRRSRSSSEGSGSSAEKVVFSSPTCSSVTDHSDASGSGAKKSHFLASGSVSVMPEYVVGQKASAPRKRNVVLPKKQKEITLQHLEYADDDD